MHMLHTTLDNISLFSGVCMDVLNGCRGGTCRDELYEFDINENELEQTFQGADADHNQMISYDEFIVVQDSMFANKLQFNETEHVFRLFAGQNLPSCGAGIRHCVVKSMHAIP